MRQAACVAGAWAASGALPLVAAGELQAHPRSLLVDVHGNPWPARELKKGDVFLFNYPYTATPVFLIAFEQEVKPAELVTESRQRYAAPGGVGPNRSIVAFSAICAHKLVYPTTAISFIGLRSGQRGEPANVIHCCGDNSQYDPLHGARVIDGPAPQPLPPRAGVGRAQRPAARRGHARRRDVQCVLREVRGEAGARERQRAAQTERCDGGRAAGGELQPAVAQLLEVTGIRAASRRPPADRDRAARRLRRIAR